MQFQYFSESTVAVSTITVSASKMSTATSSPTSPFVLIDPPVTGQEEETSSTASSHATSLPRAPWNSAIPPSLSKTPLSPLPTDLLIKQLQYYIETHDSDFYSHKWFKAHTSLLKIIKILEENASNIQVINYCIVKLHNVNTREELMAYFDRRLFFSHTRLKQYDAAWEMLPKLKFDQEKSPQLCYETCKELLSAAGFLERASKIRVQPWHPDMATRDWLLNQAEICCRRAIDAATVGDVALIHRPGKYETYAMMAVIKGEQRNHEDAAFWKSLILADGMNVEREVIFFPVLTSWMGEFKEVVDIIVQNYPKPEGEGPPESIGKPKSSPRKRLENLPEETTEELINEELEEKSPTRIKTTTRLDAHDGGVKVTKE
ncbi:hypothetical protein TWF481_008813 [Arthrobotrys musiformis]|uniref:Uncharacterized protein n=1 Tax=Arthrobotrys musiformis TaxID=47236 RepID=A0AAV9WA59_9PEZI